ncbi:MAG: transketolase [Alphaproteobacteria bacterium]|nr:transketolase [Alphaproteobacteria bacterium]
MKYDSKDLQEMASAVRSAALKSIISARSGHVGIVLGAADVVTDIFANFMRRGTDRFVLSAGHGSALLYSVLSLAGYELPPLDSFRKIGGLPGHPEFGIPGVFATTGPLGQGIGNAAGLALAEKIQKTDGRVFCLCSDGDLMEGVAQESISFAGRYKLNNLVVVWDDNGISIDGAAQTDIDVPARMLAAGWRVITTDGHDFDEIARALNAAMRGKAPVFIQAKTVIGRGSSAAGTSRAHGLGLDMAELEKLAADLWSERGMELWAEFASESANATDAMPAWSASDLSNINITWDMDKDAATRELSGIFLSRLMDENPNLVVGSADLGGSTNVKSAAARDIMPGEFVGNYINYGVREHAMGAVMNGLAAAGLRPAGSTFLVFSDYMRPSIRLAALSGLPVIYVFTHDSVAVGEDGPTHQPIEQLPSLRLMPNLNVFRPCNGPEVAAAWTFALSDTARPSCIILSRQKVRQIATPADADLSRGAYIIRPARGGRVRATLIATGTEVPLAVAAAEKMGAGVQVVSMPCVSMFRAQSDAFKKEILRGYVVAIEAAAAAPWFEFADAVVGIDEFGASGDGAAVYEQYGFDADIIARQIEKNIKK